MNSKYFVPIITISCFLLMSCTTQKTLLTPNELQNLDNIQFKQYFLERLNNVTIIKALTSGGEICLPNSYRGMSGELPRGINRKSIQFTNALTEYNTLKSELVRRCNGNENTDLKDTMMEADKITKEWLSQLFNRANTKLKQHYFSGSFIELDLLFSKTIEMLDNQKEMVSLTDVMFGLETFPKNYSSSYSDNFALLTVFFGFEKFYRIPGN